MPKRLASDLEKKLNQLLDWLNSRPCVLAFSGGVDSSTLAKAMVVASTKKTTSDTSAISPIGYFAESPSSTELERSEARRIANEIGIELQVLQSREFEDPRFVANTPKRCYWCKKIRFSSIKELANERFRSNLISAIVVIDGSNADDAHDYRPGKQAAEEIGIRSPFAELGITKSEIRELAEYWDLSVASKPSNPCLATRVAYFQKLDVVVLRQIEAAEQVLKQILSIDACRARVDKPGNVRIELAEQDLNKIFCSDNRQKIIEELRKLDFNFIALDLEGFYSGKNNRGVV